MTAQEIDRIQNAINHIRTSSDVDEWAVEIAVDAMKRQIPKKPIKSNDPYSKVLYKLNCPTCGKYIAPGNSVVGTLCKFTTAPDMCGFCGQRIDRSDEA